MNKALLYSRVSTNDKGQNPEVQANELRRYCQARGWKIQEEVVDHGFSGGTDQRPGLKRLMAAVRTREVDVVVVTKLDRMARSLKHLISLLDEFQSLGVLFVSVGDQIDLSSASGRLMLHIVAAFAEFERGLIRERTLAGLAFARSKGKQLGRPKQADYEAIRALKRKGLSYSAIQLQMKVSKGSVCRALASTPKSPSKVNSKSSIKSSIEND